MSADATTDLNATIASAVQARIETEVAAALAGDEFLRTFVSTALTQEIEVRDSNYKTRKTTFLSEMLAETIKAATTDAVKRAVSQRQGEIEAAVETMVAKNVKNIAKALTTQLVEQSANAYGFKVEIVYPGRER